MAIPTPVLCNYAANGNSMPPPAARVKADDDDIFGDAGTDYVCELPKVGHSPSVQHPEVLHYICLLCMSHLV